MKWTIRKKMNLLILTCILLMVTLIAVIDFFEAKKNFLESANAKLLSDLQLSYQYFDVKIPGDWDIQNNELYKGDVKIAGNFDIVDEIGNLADGNFVTIFQHDTRISTTIVENGIRQVNTKAPKELTTAVLEQKERFIGTTNVLGSMYQVATEPIFNSKGDIIGMWSTGTPSAPYITSPQNMYLKMLQYH